MYVWSWQLGFYSSGRPVKTNLPEYSKFFRDMAGSFFNSNPPSFLDQWKAQAEQRFIATLAIKAGLPYDTAPEIVLLLNEDDNQRLLTEIDLEKATAACFQDQ